MAKQECYKVTTVCGSNFVVTSIGGSMCEIHCLVTDHKEIVEHPQAWFARHSYVIGNVVAHTVAPYEDTRTEQAF